VAVYDTEGLDVFQHVRPNGSEPRLGAIPTHENQPLAVEGRPDSGGLENVQVVEEWERLLAYLLVYLCDRRRPCSPGMVVQYDASGTSNGIAVYYYVPQLGRKIHEIGRTVGRLVKSEAFLKPYSRISHAFSICLRRLSGKVPALFLPTSN
jgi:hypothetical protein